MCLKKLYFIVLIVFLTNSFVMAENDTLKLRKYYLSGSFDSQNSFSHRDYYRAFATSVNDIILDSTYIYHRPVGFSFSIEKTVFHPKIENIYLSIGALYRNGYAWKDVWHTSRMNSQGFKLKREEYETSSFFGFIRLNYIIKRAVFGAGIGYAFYSKKNVTQIYQGGSETHNLTPISRIRKEINLSLAHPLLKNDILLLKGSASLQGSGSLLLSIGILAWIK